MATTLKVLTMNMANYDDHGSWDIRANVFASLISDRQPDVVLFQEVRFNPDQPETKLTYQNMAEQVLFILQSKNFYRGAYHTHIPVERIPLPPGNAGFTVPTPIALSPIAQTLEWEGLSIISKFWIKETGCCWLSPPNQIITDLNTRATQYAAVDVSNGIGPETLIYFFNTHFAYNTNDAVSNVNATLTYIKKIVDINKDYFLLAGDFNMEPGSQPIQLLNSTGYLTDMWYHFWPVSPGYTYPSTQPIKRIDYMYLSTPLLQKAVSIYITGNRPDPTSGQFASDHYGLISTFNNPANSSSKEEDDHLEDSFVFVKKED